MKVFVSSFQCESNTFCKTNAKYKDFEIFYDSNAVNKLAASKIFKKNNIEIAVGIYASALPSGKVDFTAYKKISDEILERLKKNKNVDGIYLYLHGAMVVDGLGSGEEHLVRQIRDIVGYKIPIAVALDFHANNTDAFIHGVNIVEGFRTAPHTDHDETEMRAARGLVRCLQEKVLPKPVVIRVPILAADTAVTLNSPLKEIMVKINELDYADDIYSAAFFNGQPWVDLTYTGPNVVVMYKENKEASYNTAYSLAEIYWQGRTKLKFGKEVMMPRSAIEQALKEENTPVFITDSGDNTTAGAEGEGTLMLQLLLEHNVENTLVCAITAKEMVKELTRKKVGDTVSISLGSDSQENSIVPVFIEGKIKSFGRVLGWAGEECGNGVTVSVGANDVVFTDIRAAYISKKHIENMGVNVFDYKIIVLKLGYLFPDLKQVSTNHIFALTPGASTNLFESLEYQNITRPIYPIDKDFDWNRNEKGDNNEKTDTITQKR